MRDSQRSKVYRSDKSLDRFGRLESVHEIALFVRKLWNSRRFEKEFPNAWRHGYPMVGDGRGRRRATGNFSQIRMPVWSRTKGVVVHELAHTVHIRERMGGAPHGWEYCSIYLRLVMIVMGSEAHDTLKAAFKENRVRFKPKKKRYFSPEERAAIAARLSVYRESAEDRIARKVAMPVMKLDLD